MLELPSILSGTYIYPIKTSFAKSAPTIVIHVEGSEDGAQPGPSCRACRARRRYPTIANWKR